MKKVILIYAGILIGVYVLLSLLDLNSEFAIEKKLWGTHQEYSKIAKDPSVIPENKFEEVIRQYEAVVKKHPDSKVGQGVRLLIGELYTMKKDYGTARSKFRETAEMYADQDEFAAETLVRIGRTYEEEGDWAEAVKVYNQILAKYPKTRVGTGVPIYLAAHYKELNDFQNTMKYYDKAVKHYAKLAQENPDSPVEFTALRYLANCYLDQSRWREAVETLGNALIKYPTPEYLNAQRADITIKTINVVSAYQLKDFDLAVNIYKEFKAKHPDHVLNAYLDKMIESFEELKKRDVEFETPEEHQANEQQ